MRKPLVLALVVPCLVAMGFGAGALVAVPPVSSADASLLEGKPLSMLAPFIGDWEIDGAWSSGERMWARNEYRVLMNGAFVAVTTWAKDAGGSAYARYHTVYSWDEERERIVAHGFTFDGSADALEMVHGDGALSAEWADGDPAEVPTIRQRVSMPEGNGYRWQVWMVSPGTDEPVPMMDGRWVRQE